MRFNDTTCLISNQKFNKFRYMTVQNCKEVEFEAFDYGQEREELQRKMKIITHFYREMKNREEGKEEPRNPFSKLREDSLCGAVYVIAHYVTNNYTMFWLSNGSFHSKFKDGLDMLIDSEQLFYFGKDRKKVIVKLNRIAESGEEIRMRYGHVSTLIKKIRKLKGGVE